MSRFGNTFFPPPDNSFILSRATRNPLQESRLVNATPRTRRFFEMVAKVETQSPVPPIQFQSPISRLTPEILSEIFHYLAQSVTRILTVAAVCRDWRKAARQSPKLWRKVSLKISFRDMDCTRLYGILPVFQLSNQDAIELEIQYGFSQTDLHMIYNQLLILPCKQRWRVLRSGPSCIQAVFGSERSFALTALEELIIEQRNMSEHRLRSVSFKSAPNLKRLVVSMIGNFSTQQVVAPWKNLVSLTLDAKGSSCEDYLAILSECSALETCVLGFTGSHWPKPNGDFDSRMYFPWLRAFTLVGGGYINPIPFLTWVLLPSLTSLFIRSKVKFHAAPTRTLFIEQNYGHGIVDFLQASGRNLRIFELHTQDIQFSELAACLHFTPLLEFLRLSVLNRRELPVFDKKCPSRDLEVCRGIGMNMPTIDLPMLQTFTIHGLYLDLPILWSLEIVSQKKLKVRNPTYDEMAEGCITLTYRDGFLETVSGNKHLWAVDIAKFITDRGFGIELSFV